MWGEYYDNEYDTGMDLTYGEVCKNDFLAGVEYQKQQMKPLIDFVKDIRNNWDCDEDAHKYGTICRRCDAEKLLKEINYETFRNE